VPAAADAVAGRHERARARDILARMVDSAPSLDRVAILAALRAALEPRGDVLAMWEGGSVARGTDDAYSDLDLSIVAEDDAVPALWPVIEAALAACSPIALRWDAPEPAWHGHAQRVYRLRDASPFLLIDVAIMKRSSGDKFVDPELHGHARVLFDRAAMSAPRAFDEPAFRARLRAELARARTTFEMFERFVEKELARGRRFDAMHFWINLTLRPLLIVLGIRHRPLRFDWVRYSAEMMPPEIARELADLAYVRDPDDLLAKRARARALFDATLAAIDVDAIDLTALVHAARAATPTS
jgi:hypothetical protein